jgi:hypothetical protein
MAAKELHETRIPGLYRCEASRTYKAADGMGAWLVRYRDGYNGTRMGGVLRHGNWYGGVFRPAVAQLTGDKSIPEDDQSEMFGVWPRLPGSSEDPSALPFHDLCPRNQK